MKVVRLLGGGQTNTAGDNTTAAITGQRPEDSRYRSVRLDAPITGPGTYSQAVLSPMAVQQPDSITTIHIPWVGEGEYKFAIILAPSNIPRKNNDGMRNVLITGSRLINGYWGQCKTHQWLLPLHFRSTRCAEPTHTA